MKPFFDWFAESSNDTEPWLVVGKGPSFSNVRSLSLDRYRVFGLNDVCREIPVDVAHVTDLEVFVRSGPAFSVVPWVVVPFYPHIGFGPKKEWPLERIVREPGYPGHSTLIRIEEQGRLMTYRSDRAKSLPHPAGLGRAVRVRAFSAAAAVNLLAIGLSASSCPSPRHIYTIGVDGGKSYANEFSDLKPLENGRKTFDAQFSEFKLAEEKFGVKVLPIGEAS